MADLKVFENYDDNKYYKRYKEKQEREAAWFWKNAQARHGNKLRIRPKNDMLWFWALLTWILSPLKVDMLNGFTTTLFHTIWVPGDGKLWYSQTWTMFYITLKHEIAHIDTAYFLLPDAQDMDVVEIGIVRRVLGWLHAILVYPIAYVLLPFPCWFAYYRQWVEYHGFKRQIESSTSYRGGKVDPRVVTFIKRYFREWTYCKMATNKRADVLVERMVAEARKKYDAHKLDDYLTFSDHY